MKFDILVGLVGFVKLVGFVAFMEFVELLTFVALRNPMNSINAMNALWALHEKKYLKAFCISRPLPLVARDAECAEKDICAMSHEFNLSGFERDSEIDIRELFSLLPIGDPEFQLLPSGHPE